MDITESFRNEDITKNDFFDFVITSDLSDNNQQFSKHIRASNAFLSINNDNIIIKQELNNNDEENPISSTVTITSSESLTPTSTTTNLNTYDSSHYWNCDKDTIKLENSIIDDINKYYWQHDEHDSGSGSLSTKQLYENAMAAASATVTPTTTATNHNSTSGAADGSCGTLNNASTANQSTNTDGHIYTLTVLNGIDQSSWYRQTVPVSSTMLIKHDDVSLASLVSPSIDHISNSLDIDSILNIIPGHLNGYHQTSNESNHHNEHYLNDNNNNRSPNTDDGIVKTETFTYDDSGYADAKDELANTLIIDTPLLEAHDTFSQSSSWKTMNAVTSNNSSTSERAATVTTTLATENSRSDGNNQTNTNSNNHNSSADSLLRNALQGKAYVRYNGSQKLCQQYHKISMSNHSELRKALSATPSSSSSSPSSADILGVTKNHHNQQQQQQQHNLLLQSSPSTTTNKENVLRMYDNHQSQPQQQQQQHLTANGMNGIANNRRSSPLLITTNANSVNTSSSNMDDLIFQQLDGVSYPEDFEKLNTIANEVAQSVHTYCLVDNGTSSLTTSDLALLSTNTILASNNTGQLQQPTQLTLPVTATATSTTQILGTSSSSGSTSTGNKAALNRKKKLSHSTNVISSVGGNAGAATVTKPLSISSCGTSNGTAIVSLIDSSTGAAATSSSSSSSSSSGSCSNGNGRKERSLHYCGICSKGFKDKYSVNVHIRTHTGEKPFSCNLCGKSFRQKAHLAKHYQTHIAQKSASGGSSNSSSPKSVKASSR